MQHFKVGEDVVCIWGGTWTKWRRDCAIEVGNPVENGRVYRIADISHLGPFLMLGLAEVPGERFSSTGFRPVKKTDISCFERTLSRQPEKV